MEEERSISRKISIPFAAMDRVWIFIDDYACAYRGGYTDCIAKNTDSAPRTVKLLRNLHRVSTLLD